MDCKGKNHGNIGSLVVHSVYGISHVFQCVVRNERSCRHTQRPNLASLVRSVLPDEADDIIDSTALVVLDDVAGEQPANNENDAPAV